MRSFRPFLVEPDISIKELEYVDENQVTTEMFRGCSPWFMRSWKSTHSSELIDVHLGSCGCQEIQAFAEGLFYQRTVLGRLICRSAEVSRSHQQWLVLGDVATAKDVSVDHLARAQPGEFFFLHEPKEQQCGKDVTSLVDRFFCVFGGLRDTIPFFGTDGFLEQPGVLAPRSLQARVHKEPRWLGARWIHTRGSVDYLILNQNGEVGYLPIESERRIELYAKRFSEAIMRWLNDPLRDWDSGAL